MTKRKLADRASHVNKKLARSENVSTSTIPGIGDRIGKLVGKLGFRTQREFADALGVTEGSVSRYINDDRCPDPPVLLRLTTMGVSLDDLLTGRLADAKQERKPINNPPREIWQDPEWQETHSFTAMVIALRHLEAIPSANMRAWRTRVAWEAVMEASKFVRHIAGWGDEQWREIWDGRLDYWKEPEKMRAARPKRSEREALLRSLQVELGFTWDEDVEMEATEERA